MGKHRFGVTRVLDRLGVGRRGRLWSWSLSVLVAISVVAGPAGAADLKVMPQGLGTGTITSSDTLINCGSVCQATYGVATTVTLSATAATGSTFAGWDGDCTGTGSCTVTLSADISVRAKFDLSTSIPTLTAFGPTDIDNYLTLNTDVDSAPRFLEALPTEYKENWLLMTRSESLQTGTAELPRLLLPSANAQFVFTVGLATHSSYPGSHPDAIEFMQWDPTEKNFRFHEIVLDAIPAMNGLPARSRGVSVDDAKCAACHSTQNVLNNGTTVGTTGNPPGLVKAKSKPNWDAYDSWGGMLAFNRDRIYQGSVEAAAFRKIFNLWNWQSDPESRAILEQLALQPSNVTLDAITRVNGGTYDGYVEFPFDATSPVLNEPAPAGTAPAVFNDYEFDGAAGTGPTSQVLRGGNFVTLHHSTIPTSDEGRGVRLFDLLGGFGAAGSNFNAQRIADELVSHQFATGSFPIDIRPVALAITKGCLTIDQPNNVVVPSSGTLTIDLTFFDTRNDLVTLGINDLETNTRDRAESLPRRKADIEKLTLDRTGDPYLVSATDGLIQAYGATTSATTSTTFPRLRQEVFKRDLGSFNGDSTVMGGHYVDREQYSQNTEKMTLYRYFLEPLGVSVDKWSLGVRGRSRTYAMADVFSRYVSTIQSELETDLTNNPITGLSSPFACGALTTAINSTLGTLPAVNAVPTYTDIQRIFNRSCIECHGGLDYPPYSNYGSSLDLSEDESPPAGSTRLTRSHTAAAARAASLLGPLYQRVIDTNEDCPFGMMPCGGPRLSKTDIETIRRWIQGGSPRTAGDPHIRTIDGINYDFQAAGEFVLLRGEGFELQVRQTAVETQNPLGPNPYTGLTSCVSINTAVAIQIAGHRITYQPDLYGIPSPAGLELRVDGALTTVPGQEVLLTNGGRIVATTGQGGIKVEGPGGTTVTITPGWWNHQQKWYLNIQVHRARVNEGLMATLAPGAWLPALGDGTTLGPKPALLNDRYDDLYDHFGDSWRLTNASSLFDYAPGDSTHTFTIPSWPGGESPSSCVVPEQAPTDLFPQDALPIHIAELHCEGLIDLDRRLDCIQDVAATGEIGFAETYLRTELIELAVLTDAPIQLFPEKNVVYPAQELEFAWYWPVSIEDALTQRLCVWPTDQEFDLEQCLVLEDHVVTGEEPIFFSTGEIAAGQAFFWKVLATNSLGSTVESETWRFETLD